MKDSIFTAGDAYSDLVQKEFSATLKAQYALSGLNFNNSFQDMRSGP
jgi:hypothetical protein